jgi:hypothetical protein
MNSLTIRRIAATAALAAGASILALGLVIA